MSIFSSIKNTFVNAGNNIVEMATDTFHGMGENAKNALTIAGDMCIDSAHIVKSIFTDDSFSEECTNFKNDLKNNSENFVANKFANTINNISNRTHLLTDEAIDILQVFDDIYKPNEDNFKGIDNALNKISKAEDIAESVHENIDPLKDILKSTGKLLINGLSKDIISEAFGAAKEQDGIKDKITTAAQSLLYNSTINAVTSAIDAKEIKTMNDSELSDTQKYNGLTNKDMLALSNLAYTSILNENNEGRTLGEVANDIKNQILKLDDGTGNYIDENGNITKAGIKALGKNIETGACDKKTFANILNDILNNEEMSSLTILDTYDQEQNYIGAATYGHLDENGKLIENATVVFQGTSNATGWADNVESLMDPETKMQEAAREYVVRQKSVLEKYSPENEDIHISVTGHSKGGNLAMYTTIKNNEEDENSSSKKVVIDNCVSFDGEGFNKEFVQNNKDSITQNKDKITSISAYTDPVNLLLNNVAGTTHYVGIENRSTKTDENGKAIIKSMGDLGDFVTDSHSPCTMYNAIGTNGNSEWHIFEKCEIANAIENISTSTEKMNEPLKSSIVDLLTKVMTQTRAKDSAVNDKAVAKTSEYNEISGFNLKIVQTENGYNVYCAEPFTDNTIATLNYEGKLESGVITQYLNGKSEEELNDAIILSIENINQKNSA